MDLSFKKCNFGSSFMVWGVGIPGNKNSET
jgi:hypothetical protein